VEFCRFGRADRHPRGAAHDHLVERTAASVGWKVKDAIVGFHGIGRLDAVMAPAQAFGEGWWLSPV
jgi:hypothetical protein